MKQLHSLLHSLLQYPGMPTLIGSLLLLLAAWIGVIIARHLLVRIVRLITQRTSWQWDDALYQQGTFRWLARIVPIAILQIGSRWVPGLPQDKLALIDKLAAALMVFIIAMSLGATLSALEAAYRRTPHGSKRSLKGALQLAKLIIFLIALLIIVVELTGQSVGLLLSGIGALSAVLLLIFKDTILGFVAGVQLASNDMLRVGDWITVPGAGADGDVIDISLYTVKVSNFDKTITTVPTWSLVSGSYQNWRGMQDSGGRRIKRALHLDVASVRFLTADDIAQLAQLKLLSPYLSQKGDEITRWNHELGDKLSAGNLRRLTNIGTFRAYVQAYLQANPNIHSQMSCMVRQLDSGPQGIPLELYCFTTTTRWKDYEDIQSDIFDHLFALLPEFDLRLYQQPSGNDVQQALASIDASTR